jgi:hypothetical protein
MVATDWYNWNNAFINNVRAWKLENVVLKEAFLMIKSCLPDLRNISYLKKPNIPTLFPIAESYIQGLNERINHRLWRASDFIIKGGKIYRQNIEQYKLEEAAYKAQKSSLNKFQKFIFETVNSDFTAICCIFDQIYHKWYINLRN